MTYEIKYSPLAIRDLSRTWDEVLEASKSFDVTKKYLDELIDKIGTKKTFPESGAPLYYQDLFTGYYFVVYKAYIAFYRIDGNTIYVDRVLFGKSDYMKKLISDIASE